MDSLNNLPTDVINLLISFHYFSVHDLFICRFVCKSLKAHIMTKLLKPVPGLLPISTIRYSSTFSNHIAAYDSVPLLEWADRMEFLFLGVSAYRVAADIRSENLVHWLRKRRCPWNEEFLETAGRNNWWKMVRFGISNGCRR